MREHPGHALVEERLGLLGRLRRHAACRDRAEHPHDPRLTVGQADVEVARRAFTAVSLGDPLDARRPGEPFWLCLGRFFQAIDDLLEDHPSARHRHALETVDAEPHEPLDQIEGLRPGGVIEPLRELLVDRRVRVLVFAERFAGIPCLPRVA